MKALGAPKWSDKYPLDWAISGRAFENKNKKSTIHCFPGALVSGPRSPSAMHSLTLVISPQLPAAVTCGSACPASFSFASGQRSRLFL